MVSHLVRWGRVGPFPVLLTAEIPLRWVACNRQGDDPRFATDPAPDPVRAQWASRLLHQHGLPHTSPTPGVLESHGTTGSRNTLSQCAERPRVDAYPQPVVPTLLRGLIAYVYTPTSPPWHGTEPTPPDTDLYHLTLRDLCAVLHVRSCHAQGIRGTGIRIALPDTGFAHHPWFEAHGYDIQRLSTVEGMDPAEDEQGHGTAACANALAVAPGATLIGVRQSDFSATALELALAQAPNVLSCSWGWDKDACSRAELRANEPHTALQFEDMERIIRTAIGRGVSVLFSAGNGERAFPASMPEVISVGGMTLTEGGELIPSTLAGSYESRFYPGRHVPDLCGIVGEGGAYPRKGHIMLPTSRASVLEGENLPLGKTRLGWTITSGTSSAAPQVAGLVALLLEVNPHLRPDAIKAILRNTARGVCSPETGAGLIHGEAACRMARTWTPP